MAEETTCFEHKVRDEARKIKFGDISLNVETSSGSRYLEWDTERGTKTRKGENSRSHQRSFNPKAFETKDAQCPIAIYEEFLKHRPAKSKQKDSPFFLRVIPQQLISDDVWYYNQPLGKNSLGNMMSEAKKVLGDTTTTSRSKVANHSARKTSISSLLNNNVHPLHVQQLSGHKDIKSLNSHHHASKAQQHAMSNVINGANSQKNPLPNTPNNILVPSSISNSSSTVTKRKQTEIESIFYGANINNCTFNFNIHQVSSSPTNKKYKLTLEESEKCIFNVW